MSQFDFRNKKTGKFCGFDGVCVVAGGAAILPDVGAAVLNLYGFDRVEKVPPPVVNQWQAVREVEPIFIDNEWRQHWEIVNPPLADARFIQERRIYDEYLRRELLPVEFAGRRWKGGSSSGQGIRDAAEIAALLDQETVELWDVNNDSEHYSIATARQIAAAVGVAYQQVFSQRAALYKAVAAAETVDEVFAVWWDI